MTQCALDWRLPLAASCFLFFILTGCSNLSVSQNSPEPLANASAPLITPTYDGSGQTVEPYVIFFDSPWHGFPYWMEVSPYPFTNPAKENPSILVSNDGEKWRVPDGLTNPLVLPNGTNYLSDASAFYDAESDQLWVYYNVTLGTPGIALGVNRLVSADGVNWRNDGRLFQVPRCDAVSPTVGKVGDLYFMWSVKPVDCNAASSVVTYRMSIDGLNWSNPQPTNLVQPNYVIWHINVNYVPSKNEWWAAVTAYPSGQTCCTNTRLFFAKSQDGLNWTSYSKAILKASSSGWDDVEIYRASFLFNAQNNHIQVWYSATNNQSWNVGLTQEDYGAFIAWLEQ